MRSSIQISPLQQAERLVLSKPFQATLYTMLWSLIIWTVYFSTYPAVHDSAHSLRHHTLGVSCH